ncbi:MAG: hypothetical protein ACYDH9_20665 [Limisphaerales bacterium]
MVLNESDLHNLLLPQDWTPGDLEAEARRIYFQDLVPSPPQTPNCGWLEKRPIIVTNSEGAFQKIFGESEGWASYHHRKTGELDPERLRRAPWIRPILEMRAPKTRIYINSHSMKAREFGPKAQGEKKRLFVTTGRDILYFISLKYIPGGLVLTTAFPPDGEWLRKTLKAHGTVLLNP